jgi:hypothetical protein
VSAAAPAASLLLLRPRALRVAVVLGRRRELALGVFFLGAGVIVALSAEIAFCERVLDRVRRVVSAISTPKKQESPS